MFHQYKEHENGEVKDNNGRWIYATKSWATHCADDELWKIKNNGRNIPSGGAVGRRVDFWDEYGEDFNEYLACSDRCPTCFFTLPDIYRKKTVLTIHNINDLNAAFEKYQISYASLIVEALNIMVFDWEKLALDYIAVEYIPEKEEDLEVQNRTRWFPGMVVALDWKALYPANIPKDQICRFTCDIEIGDVVWFKSSGETKQIEVTRNNICVVKTMWGNQFYMSPQMPGSERAPYQDEFGKIDWLFFTPHNLEQLEAAR